jgi:ATP-dependent Clp protease protease subunit
MKTKWYEVKNQAAGTPEVFIFGDIDDTSWDDDTTTARDFINAIKPLGDFDLHINSPGGSVPAGNAIYNAMRRHQGKITAYIDGLAASIASVVAMGADKVIMPGNAIMMIHEPWSIVLGNADDMRKAADMLDKFKDSIVSAYVEKTGMAAAKVEKLMADETWMTAAEAVEMGFADEIEEPIKAAASIDSRVLARFKNVPQDLIGNGKQSAPAAKAKPQNLRELLLDQNTSADIYAARNQ